MSYGHLAEQVTFSPVQLDPAQVEQAQRGLHPDHYALAELGLMAQANPRTITGRQLSAGMGTLALLRGVSHVMECVGEVEPVPLDAAIGEYTRTYAVGEIEEALGERLAFENIGFTETGPVSAVSVVTSCLRSRTLTDLEPRVRTPTNIAVGFELADGNGKYQGFFANLDASISLERKVTLAGASGYIRHGSILQSRDTLGLDIFLLLSCAGKSLEHLQSTA